MKGIIFSEFLELVENQFGLDVCQAMLDESDDAGVYTTVGTYDHRYLIKLIVTLSRLTGVSPEQLQEVYGESLFIHLFRSMPELEGSASGTFEFIGKVEEYIHIEVKKLYPDANPPTFKFISKSSAQLVMDYISARCMSHVCLGLIKGCATHFNENIDINMAAQNDDESVVRFKLVCH